jgi:hypothetical protein
MGCRATTYRTRKPQAIMKETKDCWKHKRQKKKKGEKKERNSDIKKKTPFFGFFLPRVSTLDVTDDMQREVDYIWGFYRKK